jgi:NAD(P)-dependent dehydrogenase (short-subunit alcohol dehydrogenase family)
VLLPFFEIIMARFFFNLFMTEEEDNGTVSVEQIDPAFPLKGQVAFVTGSTSGIGRGIAIRFAQDGADVIIHGRNADKAAEVKSKIEALGRNVAVVIADLAVEEERERACKEALSAFGHVDVLVNNAGYGTKYPFLTMPDNLIDEMLEVNLRAVIYITKRILKAMVKNPRGVGGIRGRVINISSIDGKTGRAEQAVYGATKFAIVGFTQVLAIDLGARGIIANAICPGHIDTPMWGPAGVQSRGLEGTPLKRYGTPADIAEAASFLADPRNSFITGQSINVCGGREFH